MKVYYILGQEKVQVKLTGLAKPITSNYTLAQEAQGQKLCKELHDLFCRQEYKLSRQLLLSFSRIRYRKLRNPRIDYMDLGQWEKKV